MNAEDVLAELEHVLALEREAIRASNAEGVLEAATKKEKLSADLVDSGAWARPEMADGLRRLLGDLRHNGVLLADAGDCLRDAIAALRESPSAQSMRKIALRLSATP